MGKGEEEEDSIFIFIFLFILYILLCLFMVFLYDWTVLRMTKLLFLSVQNTRSIIIENHSFFLQTYLFQDSYPFCILIIEVKYIYIL